jgi:hypothetical protein
VGGHIEPGHLSSVRRAERGARLAERDEDAPAREDRGVEHGAGAPISGGEPRGRHGAWAAVADRGGRWQVHVQRAVGRQRRQPREVGRCGVGRARRPVAERRPQHRAGEGLDRGGALGAEEAAGERRAQEWPLLPRAGAGAHHPGPHLVDPRGIELEPGREERMPRSPTRGHGAGDPANDHAPRSAHRPRGADRTLEVTRDREVLRPDQPQRLGLSRPPAPLEPVHRVGEGAAGPSYRDGAGRIPRQEPLAHRERGRQSARLRQFCRQPEPSLPLQERDSLLVGAEKLGQDEGGFVHPPLRSEELEGAPVDPLQLGVELRAEPDSAAPARRVQGEGERVPGARHAERRGFVRGAARRERNGVPERVLEIAALEHPQESAEIGALAKPGEPGDARDEEDSPQRAAQREAETAGWSWASRPRRRRARWPRRVRAAPERAERVRREGELLPHAGSDRGQGPLERAARSGASGRRGLDARSDDGGDDRDRRAGGPRRRRADAQRVPHVGAGRWGGRRGRRRRAPERLDGHPLRLEPEPGRRIELLPAGDHDRAPRPHGDDRPGRRPDGIQLGA